MTSSDSTTTSTARGTALVVGASRTIGLGLAAELLKRGWRVIATARSSQPGPLRDLAERSRGLLTVEMLDMTDQSQLDALGQRLQGTSLDLLFINAAITNGDEQVGQVSTDVFVEVMVTNALAPMRVVETLEHLVARGGTIGVMSSSQGSLTLNTNGGHEVYRASKSALNQLMRSYAARRGGTRTLLLVNPGWVKTELGGQGAQLTIDQSVPGVVDVLEDHAGRGGLHFLDHRGQTVPW